MSVVWALVPVKELTQAKTRLASILTLDERRALMLAMLDDVLQALSNVFEITHCLVITRDAEASDVAQRRGAMVLSESSVAGDLNAALLEGIRFALDAGATSTLIVPADVPSTIASQLERVLSEAAPAPSVTLAPSEDGDGTNALLLTPPDVIALSYGVGSCRAHLQAGRAVATVTRLELPGLALDLDEPLDLVTFLDRTAQGATHGMLKVLDLHRRLLQNAPQA